MHIESIFSPLFSILGVAATTAIGCGGEVSESPPRADITSPPYSIEIVASEQPGPMSLALDANYVYWTNYGESFGTGAVMRAPIAGGGEAETLAEGLDYPRALAVDGAGVTWINGGSANGSTLMRTSLAGGAFFALASATGVVAGLAATDERVYWSDTASGEVKSVGVDGCDERVEASDQRELGPLTIVGPGASVLWVADSALMRKDAGDGLLELWKGETPTSLSSAGTTVAWITSTGEVMKAAGATVTRLASIDDEATRAHGAALAVDPTRAYIANLAAGALLSVPLSGGAPVVVVEDVEDAVAVAVDATHVYWCDAARGTVSRAPKSAISEDVRLFAATY